MPSRSRDGGSCRGPVACSSSFRGSAVKIHESTFSWIVTSLLKGLLCSWQGLLSSHLAHTFSFFLNILPNCATRLESTLHLTADYSNQSSCVATSSSGVREKHEKPDLRTTGVTRTILERDSNEVVYGSKTDWYVSNNNQS